MKKCSAGSVARLPGFLSRCLIWVGCLPLPHLKTSPTVRHMATRKAAPVAAAAAMLILSRGLMKPLPTGYIPAIPGQKLLHGTGDGTATAMHPILLKDYRSRYG